VVISAGKTRIIIGQRRQHVKKYLNFNLNIKCFDIRRFSCSGMWLFVVRCVMSAVFYYRIAFILRVKLLYKNNLASV
jgi:hypothetical protein